MNGLTTSLAGLLVDGAKSSDSAAALVSEKILLAPTRRMGRKWLRQLVMAGRSVLNVRIETFSSLAMRLLGQQFSAAGLKILPAELGPLLADKAAAEVRASSSDKLPVNIEASLSYGSGWWRSMSDLRRYGINASDLEKAGFESSDQGRLLMQMLVAYESLLKSQGYADSPELLALAAGALARDPAMLSGCMVITSDEFQSRWTPGMWRLWKTIMPENRAVASCDLPPRLPPAKGEALADSSARLRSVLSAGNMDMQLFRAAGLSSEVRRVLRWCVVEGIPLDSVELLYTDRSACLPVIYAQWRSAMDSAGGVTFLEGLPVSFSRPGRLVKKWCDWLRGDYDQPTLHRILLDGLLQGPGDLDAREIAARLDALPIFFGRQRRQKLLKEAIAAGSKFDQESDDSIEDFNRDCDSRTRHLMAADKLLDIITPSADAADEAGMCSPSALLACLLELLDSVAVCSNRLDNLSRQRIAASLSVLRQWHEDNDAGVRVRLDEFLEKLTELVDSALADARGPQEGCLYVAPLAAGGYSGRKYTFIVGMNDDLFPGSTRQDPMLSDRQRERITDAVHKPLGLSWHSGYCASEDFISLLARLRGNVQVSYCSYDIAADSVKSPATVMLSLAAALAGERWGDTELLEKLCGESEIFIPAIPAPPATSYTPAAALDKMRLRLAGGQFDSAALAEYAQGEYSHLFDGRDLAVRSREIAAFTDADGNVTAEQQDWQRAFSPSGLEMLAACPRRFFFRYVLGVKAPQRKEMSQQFWLDPLDFGTLVHDAFCEFYRGWVGRFDSLAEMNLDGADEALGEVLDRHIERFRKIVPAACVNAFNATCREAREAARVLLSSDRNNFNTWDYRPWQFEASIGMPPENIETKAGDVAGGDVAGGDVAGGGVAGGGVAGGELDRLEAVAISLPSGVLNVRGRLDRIDRSCRDSSAVAIWDYKTGSPGKYEHRPPFNQGRILQICLYPIMVQAVLDDVCVERVGYFFTGRRGRGRIISYNPAELAAEDPSSRDVLDILLRLIRSGSYPATDDFKDCSYCDYADICGDAVALTRLSRQRLENCPEAELDGFRKLRGRVFHDG